MADALPFILAALLLTPLVGPGVLLCLCLVVEAAVLAVGRGR